MIDSLEQMLCEITGFPGMSLQPNSGASGEYAGLRAIRAYQAAQGQARPPRPPLGVPSGSRRPRGPAALGVPPPSGSVREPFR